MSVCPPCDIVSVVRTLVGATEPACPLADPARGRMPRALSPAAMARRLRAPPSCNSTTAAANASARTLTASQPAQWA
jgi:hypothetical protein